MRKAEIFLHDKKAGVLIEEEKDTRYRFLYNKNYVGPNVSVTMPVRKQAYTFDRFPPFFEGLLPEGANLEMLLRRLKIDRNDPYSQLMAVGADTVGAVTVREAKV